MATEFAASSSDASSAGAPPSAAAREAELAAGAAGFAAARNGSPQALGALLDNYRSYLLLVANATLGSELKAKIGASDLVQETFLEAQKIFDRFSGGSEEELRRWLVRILEYKLANASKRYSWADKRLVSREVVFDSWLGADLQNKNAFIGADETPSAILSTQEEEHRLKAAIEELPSDYRQAVALRCGENLSFVEVAERMNRSADAVRKLFARAVDLLGERMRDHEEQRPV